MDMDDNSFGFEDSAEEGGFAPTLGTGSGVGVLRVGKRDYAIGLQWNAVEQPSKAAKEAREMAANPSFEADFFCVRDGGTPQYGLGFKAQGHKSGMPSLAAHAAASKGGSWLGLYEVEGGYYIIAVRDDGILSECDRYFDNQDDARALFEDLQQRSEWDFAFAPSVLGISDTQHEEITDLLTGRPKVRLQDVSRSSALLKLGIGVLVIGGILIGGMLYMDHQEAERLRMEAEEALRRAQQAVVGPDEQEIQIPPMPWENQAMAVPFLERCVADIGEFPLDIPGWKVSAAVCDGAMRDVHVRLERKKVGSARGGTMNWIEMSIRDFGRGATLNWPKEGSVDQVIVSWQIDNIPNIPVDLETAPVSLMRKALLVNMEERMTPISFQDADNTEFWRGFTFTFSTHFDPLAFADLIGALPGAMLPRVSYDVSSNEWIIEGKAYEQLPYQPQNVQ